MTAAVPNIHAPVHPSAQSARSRPDCAAGLVGDTPVLRIGAPFAPDGRGFWAKLEGANPGGIKDRTALHMVAEARRRGALRPGARIIESTSGTLGLGLALAGIAFEHPVTLVSDPGLEPMMRALLTGYGAEVEIVRAPDPVGGWQQARRTRVTELLQAHQGAWCPDQYNNPDNVTAYAPLAHELIAQLGRIDALVTAVGTGGHSAGIAAVLRERYPGLRAVAVDTIGSRIFGQPDAPRLIRGLGSSIHPRNVAYHLFDEVHWVAPAEAVWAARALARAHYASGGWSVGAVALVARWLAGVMDPGARIVAVFPDGPHRYTTTVFDDEYCRAHDLPHRAPAEAPDEIGEPGERQVHRWTRCTTVTDPLGSRLTVPEHRTTPQSDYEAAAR